MERYVPDGGLDPRLNELVALRTRRAPGPLRPVPASRCCTQTADDNTPGAGSLYRVDPDGTVTRSAPAGRIGTYPR